MPSNFTERIKRVVNLLTLTLPNSCLYFTSWFTQKCFSKNYQGVVAVVLPILLWWLSIFPVIDQGGVDEDGQDVKDMSEKIGVVCQVNHTSSYDLQLYNVQEGFKYDTSLIFGSLLSVQGSGLTWYCKDTEPLYHSFMYSLVSHFFPVSIHCLQCIHCLLHQTQEICIIQNVH